MSWRLGERFSTRTLCWWTDLFLKDGKTTAIYIPVEPTANGKAIADFVRKIVKEVGPPEEYYLAGDPIARGYVRFPDVHADGSFFSHLRDGDVYCPVFYVQELHSCIHQYGCRNDKHILEFRPVDRHGFSRPHHEFDDACIFDGDQHRYCAYF